MVFGETNAIQSASGLVVGFASVFYFACLFCKPQLQLVVNVSISSNCACLFCRENCAVSLDTRWRLGVFMEEIEVDGSSSTGEVAQPRCLVHRSEMGMPSGSENRGGVAQWFILFIKELK